MFWIPLFLSRTYHFCLLQSNICNRCSKTLGKAHCFVTLYYCTSHPSTGIQNIYRVTEWRKERTGTKCCFPCQSLKCSLFLNLICSAPLAQKTWPTHLAAIVPTILVTPISSHYKENCMLFKSWHKCYILKHHFSQSPQPFLPWPISFSPE